MKSQLRNPQRPLLVYLADNLIAMGDRATDTARSLWEGVSQDVEQSGADLLAVVGGGVRESFGSVIYDLITPDVADGFVSWIFRSSDEADVFFERFAHSPLVTISIPYPPHPLVCIQSEPGMQELMRHLIHDHGYRRLAFIGGQAGHPSAQERRHVYEDTLREAGITPQPEWAVPDAPNWAWQSGVNGVGILLDERGLQPGIDLDGIVCASDRLAMGALDELIRRGIQVPSDLALTGFNNLLEAQSNTPSITSVSAPFVQQGREAVQVVQALMQGQAVPVRTALSSVMVPGESCGCLKSHSAHILQPEHRTEHKRDAALLVQIRARMQSMRTPPPDVDESAAALLAAWRLTCKLSQPMVFLGVLASQIDAAHSAFVDQVHWHEVLTLLRIQELEGLPLPGMLQAESVLDDARQLVADRYARSQTLFRLQEIRTAGCLREISARLAFAVDVAGCIDILSEELPHLGVTSCWISLFESTPGLPRAPEFARNVLALHDGQRLPLPPGGVRFIARELVPAELAPPARRRTLIMYPLESGEDEFGFVIFAMGSDDGSIYEALAGIIGNSFKSSLLRATLANRTSELETSLKNLRLAQEQLVESEKMAALGELVAGIAHEINTPIGISMTSITTVSQSGHELLQALEQRSARGVREAALNMIDGAEIVQRNLERANELIESFKLIAVDQTCEEARAFELGAYLHDIARSLEPRLRPDEHHVEIDCPEAVRYSGDAGAFARVISNLILNSVIHGFEGRKGGVIRIRCCAEREQVLLDYRDDGCGMTPDVLEKLFNPFFTTKRGRGGTGLGMHIVYNTVTQGLGGTIECESAPGKGVRFVLSLPAAPVWRE